MRRLMLLPLLSLLLLPLSGCFTFEEPEIERTSDLSIEDLEHKMQRARDPDGVFRKATSFVQRQVVTSGRRKILVEAKYLAPDRFKVVNLEDNAPSTATILNGDVAWQVDYKNQAIVPIVGDDLFQLKIMSQLGNPDTSYRKLFAQAELTLCKIGDAEFYKLVCTSKIPSHPKIIIYVNRINFLVSRIAVPDRNYVSQIDPDSYTLFEGVLMPQSTTIRSGNVTMHSKIIENHLNVVIDPSEFTPPTFNPLAK